MEEDNFFTVIHIWPTNVNSLLWLLMVLGPKTRYIKSYGSEDYQPL